MTTTIKENTTTKGTPKDVTEKEFSNTETFVSIISEALALPRKSVSNTMALLADGCTVPFIARYRKEMTGSLDEVSILKIQEYNDKLTETAKRKSTILAAIAKQGKLTTELEKRISDCWDLNTLEDLYLPYKTQRRTKAQIAREHGLEPLARSIMLNSCRDPYASAQRFITKEVTSVDAAIKGAQDIITEEIANNEESRKITRNEFRRTATISAKVVKSKKEDDDCQKYSDYFEFSEQLKRSPSHRILAILRGEKEGFLKVKLSTNDEAEERIRRHYTRSFGECAKLMGESADNAYKQYIFPAIEREFLKAGREKAEAEAIEVFSDNLRQLLLSAPLGQKAIMGIDPGFRTGCKVACIDAEGKFLHYETIFPFQHEEKAMLQVLRMATAYSVEAIAIGNGTASRETEKFVRSIAFPKAVSIFVVSEDGASVYSASEMARREFPDLDVTVRGAISIARRLMDPLSELVKVDPKSIGVGQYQHDVDQTLLNKRLEQTVESCVNMVGVNVNTASAELLRHVSGIGPSLAANIVSHRNANGAFKSRAELKRVKGLGANTFTQCAGFLRIPHGTNPLDNTAVHPERYAIVKQMAADINHNVQDLIADKKLQEQIDIRKYVNNDLGMPTLQDIMQELKKPGRDPRQQIEEFKFDENVTSMDDLRTGMVLPGIVTNITNFGAFVNIGVHQDGLVHVSQMSTRYIASPLDAVKLHQQVMVKVTGVDTKRKRISLSMILD